MKKLNRKARDINVKVAYLHRTAAGKGSKTYQRKRRDEPKSKKQIKYNSWKATKAWMERNRENGLIYDEDRNRITLFLPEELNFSDKYEESVLYILAIRKLTETTSYSKSAYRLVSVRFDNLKQVSTSYALVLTAEISRWDDVARQRIVPQIQNWEPDIVTRFLELGFFDLFSKGPESIESEPSSIQLVKYIKGKCGDKEKVRQLKDEILSIVGLAVKKWTFLHSGLSEAIINVSHHAYPNSYNYKDDEKNWFIGGSFDKETKQIRIVFYDQGIGIPKSLPASRFWEKVLDFFGNTFEEADKLKDEVLLKAAVELDRTSTDVNDRGKGLQDLLEFVKQRENGFLAIISRRGLYKYTVSDGEAKVKTERFRNPLCGTLIIWNAVLNEDVR